MGFPADNRAYEAWLRTQCRVVDNDLGYKHERMKESAFVFLRATFFRWARRDRGDLSRSRRRPKVLAVGELHVENFGTWRDREGRLVWGVNDFDEGAVTPYVFDLVRLATSARLAPDRRARQPQGRRRHSRRLPRRPGEAPADPARRAGNLDARARRLLGRGAGEVLGRGRRLSGGRSDPPRSRRPCAAACPRVPATCASRRAGRAAAAWADRATSPSPSGVAAGSSGRQRPWCPRPGIGRTPIEAPVFRALDLATGAYRSPDPHLAVADRFIIRRVAADSQKVESRRPCRRGAARQDAPCHGLRPRRDPRGRQDHRPPDPRAPRCVAVRLAARPGKECRDRGGGRLPGVAGPNPSVAKCERPYACRCSNTSSPVGSMWGASLRDCCGSPVPCTPSAAPGADNRTGGAVELPGERTRDLALDRTRGEAAD